MQTAFTADDLLTVRQVAEMFHLGEKSIRDRILAGRLPAQKLEGGKQWLIRREDALGALRRMPNSESHSVLNGHPGIVPAGADPMQIMPNAGIIRRTHTLEGRTRALAALNKMLEGDEEEQRCAGEHLQRSEPKSPIEFRRWNVETWERLGDPSDAPADDQAEGP